MDQVRTDWTSRRAARGSRRKAKGPVRRSVTASSARQATVSVRAAHSGTYVLQLFARRALPVRPASQPSPAVGFPHESVHERHSLPQWTTHVLRQLAAMALCLALGQHWAAHGDGRFLCLASLSPHTRELPVPANVRLLLSSNMRAVATSMQPRHSVATCMLARKTL